MFQNSFQNGNYFELFDPKVSQDKLKNLYKLVNVNPNNKVFDKELKTYVYEFTSPNAKMIFPKQDKKDLYLIQQYIIFQIYFFHGLPWSMQLVISDLNKTKRRIMLSSANNKLQIKPFFVKSPTAQWKEGCWNSFAIDLYSFMDAFKGQTYRCLDSITIQGCYKLRRVYTTNMMPQHDGQEEVSVKEISLLPKNFYFPPEIESAAHLTKYMGETLSQINLYEPTEPSTKNNSSYLKSSKNRMSTPKTQTTKSQKIVVVGNLGKNTEKNERADQKMFLANTNGPQMLNRMRKREKYNESSDSQVTDTVNTPQSTQKTTITSKKKLIKTQQIPPKSRTSVQKRQTKPVEAKNQKEKQKLKSKLNPWRVNTNLKGQTSDIKSKNDPKNKNEESDLQLVSSPNTTQFKVKNEFTESISKGFDRRSDHYSESEYIELSQKFSTLTDGKFFNQKRLQLTNSNTALQQKLSSHNQSFQPSNLQNTEQIQQNIEMQTNSIYSSSNKKPIEELNPKKMMDYPQLKELQLINESICDSLDRRSPQKDFQVIGKQSYYGFGDRLMNQYMRDKERPYSPPMREKQYTEEESYEDSAGKIPAKRPQMIKQEKSEKQVQLVYDPVLNCYYDHKTHTYYELKN